MSQSLSLGGNDGGNLVRIWDSRDELQAELGISRSTFFRRVKAGQIAKQKVDGRTLYRCETSPAPPVPTVSVSTPAPTETKPAEVSPNETAGETLRLAEINDRLVARLVELERDNAVADHLRRQAEAERNRLAEELAEVDGYLVRAVAALTQSNKDARRLHAAIEAVTEAVADVATSPLSLPIRGRLRAALAT